MELLSEITTKLSIAASHKAWSQNSDQGTEIYIQKIWGQAHSLMEQDPGIPEPYSQRREEANPSGEVCRTQSQAVNIMNEAAVAIFCIHWSITSNTGLKKASLASMKKGLTSSHRSKTLILAMSAIYIHSGLPWLLRIYSVLVDRKRCLLFLLHLFIICRTDSLYVAPDWPKTGSIGQTVSIGKIFLPLPQKC